MRRIFVAAFCLLALAAAANGAEKHLLYLTSPDGAQSGGSGVGLLVFDMDNGHKFVRRIDVPSLKEGVRGVCANALTHRLYVTTSEKRLVCLDLLTDKVLWEKVYDTGCDRLAITPDGKTLYVPSGWWNKQTSWLVIDAADGAEKARIAAPAPGHNTLVSLDGRRAYLASNSVLSVVDTATNQVLHEIQSGSHNFYPFTVNSDGSRAYICLGHEIGFEIVDPEAGKVLQTVYPDGPRLPRRTHGVGLTPDEKELWVSDQEANALYVFDNTASPPRQIGTIKVSKGGHGWVGFSIDGRFAYTAAPEVFDVKTRQTVATLKDESGRPTCSSKYVEIDFRDGEVSRVGDQFGVGRAHVPTAMAP